MVIDNEWFVVNDPHGEEKRVVADLAGRSATR
jgi:hypothetical protein